MASSRPWRAGKGDRLLFRPFGKGACPLFFRGRSFADLKAVFRPKTLGIQDNSTHFQAACQALSRTRPPRATPLPLCGPSPGSGAQYVFSVAPPVCHGGPCPAVRRALASLARPDETVRGTPTPLIGATLNTYHASERSRRPDPDCGVAGYPWRLYNACGGWLTGPRRCNKIRSATWPLDENAGLALP